VSEVSPEEAKKRFYTSQYDMATRPDRYASHVEFDCVMGNFKIDGRIIPWRLARSGGFKVEKVAGYENPPYHKVTVAFQVMGDVDLLNQPDDWPEITVTDLP